MGFVVVAVTMIVSPCRITSFGTPKRRAVLIGPRVLTQPQGSEHRLAGASPRTKPAAAIQAGLAIQVRIPMVRVDIPHVLGKSGQSDPKMG